MRGDRGHRLTISSAVKRAAYMEASLPSLAAVRP